MAHSDDAFVWRQGILIQHPGDTINLVIALSMGLLGFVSPWQARQVAIASPLPSAPTRVEEEAAAGRPQKAQYKITLIIVRGNRRVPASTLRARISIRLGDIYDSAKIERDVTALKNTGYFDDVRATTKDDPTKKNGKIITFTVREKKELVWPNAALERFLKRWLC
jgi:outer membrane protein assembly factor BamA